MEPVLVDRQEKVWTITLNRPERYNALDESLSRALIKTLKEAGKASGLRVVVLTGAGNAFCAGQDLKELQERPDLSFEEVLKGRYNQIVQLIRSLPVPVVCRLNGVAAGAGLGIALACDYIVASEQATLNMAFIKVGLVPDSGASFFLVKQIGYHRAFEYATTGRPIPAGEALALGLVNEVVPAARLDDAVQKVVEYYMEAPTQAIALTKRLLHRAEVAHSLDEVLEWETYYQQVAGATEDQQEGKQAFLEKRAPKFKGR